MNDTCKRNGVFQYTQKLEHYDILVKNIPFESAESDQNNQLKSTPEHIREKLINELKEKAEPDLVNSKIPVFKQINAALGIYDDKTKKEIINWINAVRKSIDDAEKEINSIKNKGKLQEFEFDFEKLRKNAETTFKNFEKIEKTGEKNVKTDTSKL